MIKLLKDSKGQAMLELALVLPILLLLIFGIIEFGKVFSTQLILVNSAREGARKAVVGASYTEITQTIEQSASVLDFSKMTVAISPDNIQRNRGEAVTVHLEYPVKIYTPIISNLIGDPYIVSSEATMRIE